MMPDYSLEAAHAGLVAGIDEAGRGPWAGPVLAAAVVLDASRIPAGIHDSKQLKKAERERLFDEIMMQAHVGIGISSVTEIDTLNILGATKLAMRRALEDLTVEVTLALIDGNQPPVLSCRTQCIVGGDGKSLSIAAASIIAKVTRDRMMAELAKEFPMYGWESNAGYGTPRHQAGLSAHGVTPHHRRSFAPIRALLEQAEVA